MKAIDRTSGKELALNLAVAEISVIEVDPDKNASSREGDAVAEGVRLTRSEEPGPTAPRLRRRAN